MTHNALPANLELVLEALDHVGLDTQARRNLQTCIRTFCKVAGMPPAAIATDIEGLRNCISKGSPGGFNITAAYWSQIRSGLWKALALCGFQVMRSVGVELSPELAEVANVRDDKGRLTPLLKFLAEHKVSSHELTQTHVPIYRQWLQAHYSKTNWQRAFKRSIEAWNSRRACLPRISPAAPLIAEFTSRNWWFQWERFPALEIEVDQHLADLSKPRSRRRGASRKPLSAAYILARKGYILRAASAAVLKLGAETQICSLEQLTEPVVVEALTDHLIDRCGTARSGDAAQYLRHLNSIAKHWVKRTKEEYEELKNIRRSVVPAGGPSEKNRHLLELFRDPELRLKFIQMPERVMRRLARTLPMTSVVATQGMLAYAAGFLTNTPLRISELLALLYGKTFHDHGQGRTRRVTVDLPEEMVKNGVARLKLLGPRSVKMLDFYTTNFRPALAPKCNLSLFPSGENAARNSDHFSQSLAQFMSRELGIRMTAHQFRHVVGYIFLCQHPGCYEAVRHFLGHRSIVTTIKYYAFILDDDANEILDSTIDELADRAVVTRRRKRQ